jgi:hypothetical protein
MLVLEPNHFHLQLQLAVCYRRRIERDSSGSKDVTPCIYLVSTRFSIKQISTVVHFFPSYLATSVRRKANRLVAHARVTRCSHLDII